MRGEKETAKKNKGKVRSDVVLELATLTAFFYQAVDIVEKVPLVEEKEAGAETRLA